MSKSCLVVHIIQSIANLKQNFYNFLLADRLHQIFGNLSISAVLREDIVIIMILKMFDELTNMSMIQTFMNIYLLNQWLLWILTIHFVNHFHCIIYFSPDRLHLENMWSWAPAQSTNDHKILNRYKSTLKVNWSRDSFTYVPFIFLIRCIQIKN